MEPENSTPAIPVIFTYYDYREYLRDLVAFHRRRSPVFSHRYIVQKAGFKSPTALKHVIDGKRNLSLEAANRFAAALKIEGISRHYFLTLVLFNQSVSLAEQEKYLKELMELKRAENPSLLAEERFEVLAKWYHLAIREIVELPDFRNSATWISKALCPEISSFEASQSLQLLKKLGLIDMKEGKLHSADHIIATNNQVHSVKAAEFHRQMIQRASEAITRFPSDEREISGTLLRISRRDVLHIKTLLREFRKKLLSIASNSATADQVYQLNFQFFPLVIPERTNHPVVEREHS